MSKISAIIVVKDNPIHFTESLHSLDFVHEIVIVDIGMNDEARKTLSHFHNIKIEIICKQIQRNGEIKLENK